MDQRVLRFLLVASIIFVAGCDAGIQRGKYIVGTGGGEVLANNGGWISKFCGTSVDNLNSPDQLLIAFLFVGPDFHAASDSHQTYRSSLDVKTPIKDFTIEWDRRSEVVAILRAEYDRSNGNVFIVRMNGADISSHQIKKVIDADATDEILTAVKQALPDDAEVQALAARSIK